MIYIACLVYGMFNCDGLGSLSGCEPTLVCPTLLVSIKHVNTLVGFGINNIILLVVLLRSDTFCKKKGSRMYALGVIMKYRTHIITRFVPFHYLC